eukprot:c14287_g1_i1.p1 GENE.c14287_g1_i1~~c14287_g1_i1.p1  ORF type:complete len:235 (+),score=95.24 c14287_g1_i1:56-760(+)
MRPTPLFTLLKRYATTTTPVNPRNFRTVGIQFTKMELFTGKWAAFAEQIPQMAREIEQMPKLVHGGAYYAAMNLGTKPAHQTEALSLVMFDSVELAEEALSIKPKTRTILQSIMKSPPQRSIFQGIVLQEATKTNTNACFATTWIPVKEGKKQECLQYLKDRFPGFGPNCEWICALTSPGDEDSPVMVVLAFSSYEDFRKAKEFEVPFLAYLSAYGNGMPTLDFHEQSSLYFQL